MEQQEYEWQDEHYQYLAEEVQQELCSLLGYREKSNILWEILIRNGAAGVVSIIMKME